MPIFKINKEKLEQVKEKAISLEKDLQKLTEDNLEIVFRLTFVKSEFTLDSSSRIDTLAFDEESKSFVIIEYKKTNSFSVVDQGFSYLSSALRYKEKLLVEYNEKLDKNLKREDVDWSQLRVVFVSTGYTVHQQNAINFKDLPIELWKVKLFENDTILYNQVLASKTSQTIKNISNNETIKSVSKEIRVYNEEDHLKGKPETIVNLFNELEERIFNLGDDIEKRIRLKYISYSKNKAFVYTHPQASKIKLHLAVEINKLDDPKGMARDMRNIGHHGGGYTQVLLEKPEDLNYIMNLIEQTYKNCL